MAAIRNLDRFDRGRPFGPWLHRIVVNRAIDWTRARQLRDEAELVDAEAPEHTAPLDASLLAALAALPAEHRGPRRARGARALVAVLLAASPSASRNRGGDPGSLSRRSLSRS